jgi:CheY-like chemotaxis protein
MTARSRILLIDDDADIRSALAEILEDEGYDVSGAGNGEEALARLQSAERPCVILLDLMMPVMDGYQFREAQKREAMLSAIPVVVITAGSSLRAHELDDVAAILPKPIELPKLMATIRRHCG